MRFPKSLMQGSLIYCSDTSSTRKVVVIELSMVDRNWIRTVWPLYAEAFRVRSV
jgi:hypothetical protein